jgi:transcriptional regulator with XRE-family HTH domain/anti-sigma regulatory factor (Ser/Thr protein kinase)
VAESRVVSLGERLKDRREQLGISQAQAARELDVARTAYRLWEMEAAKPAPDRWRLISRWLGVSVATLLLAEDLVGEEEARHADVISARFGDDGWDAEGAGERGTYFEQERAAIAQAEGAGRLSGPEAAGLSAILDSVEVRSIAGRTSDWRPSTLEKELPVDVSAAALGRAAVLVVAAGVPERILLDAELLTSELITNSLRHGPDDADSIQLRIVVGREALRVEVADRGVLPVRPREPDEAGGWGFTLVMALASRWGGDRAGDRNVTWFEIDLPQPGGAPSVRPDPAAAD